MLHRPRHTDSAPCERQLVFPLARTTVLELVSTILPVTIFSLVFNNDKLRAVEKMTSSRKVDIGLQRLLTYLSAVALPDEPRNSEKIPYRALQMRHLHITRLFPLIRFESVNVTVTITFLLINMAALNECND